MDQPLKIKIAIIIAAGAMLFVAWAEGRKYGAEKSASQHEAAIYLEGLKAGEKEAGERSYALGYALGFNDGRMAAKDHSKGPGFPGGRGATEKIQLEAGPQPETLKEEIRRLKSEDVGYGTNYDNPSHARLMEIWFEAKRKGQPDPLNEWP